MSRWYYMCAREYYNFVKSIISERESIIFKCHEHTGNKDAIGFPSTGPVVGGVIRSNNRIHLQMIIGFQISHAHPPVSLILFPM